MKLSIIVASSTAVALAGCSLTQIKSDINATISSDLPSLCALLSTEDAAFQTIAASGKLSATVKNDEAAAMAAVGAICANPSSVSTATALQTAASAYSAVVKALAAANGG